jgi:hypothetical protein
MAKGSKAIGQTGKGKTAARGALPIWFASSDTWDSVRAGLPPEAAAFAKASGYAPKPGALLICPDSSGQIACALFGLEAEGARKPHDPFLPARAMPEPAGRGLAGYGMYWPPLTSMICPVT